MKATRWLVILTVYWMSAHGNFYFATHSSYLQLAYDIDSFALVKISGCLESVTQQCRRSCASQTKCQAFTLALQSGNLFLGAFLCRLFQWNACSWQHVALRQASPISYIHLWEKLLASTSKPKPCWETCAFQYQGNCTACRGYSALAGMDCEIAPKLCSDYPASPPSTTWKLRQIWPWGIYGQMLTVQCRNDATGLLFRKIGNSTTRILSSPGLNEDFVANFTTYPDGFEQIDWTILSALTALSTQKILRVYVTLDSVENVYNFSGFELGPRGELTLNASVGNSTSTGFPTPLIKVPFVSRPPGYNSNCGPFWRIEPSVSYCQQRSNFFSFFINKWDGFTPQNGIGATVSVI